MKFFLAAASIIALDQITKWLVVLNFHWGEKLTIFNPWLHFTYVTNTGAAFGVLPGRNWVFVVFSFIVVAGIVFYNWVYKPSFSMAVTTALIAGGAAGNLIDRLFRSEVVDFIDLGWWPVFNIADSAIFCGAVSLLIFTFIQNKNEVSSE
ncbi:MAG: signal peptidase II [Syntrophomonadaceae bacterium]|nr:signal peptidase II [Syntrophomonadaceae bacterium]